MKLILIVDDDMLVRRAYERVSMSMLAKQAIPCLIFCCTTGETAMTHLRALDENERNDLMLLTDGDMTPAGGTMTGEELIREVRALCGDALKMALLVSTLSHWTRLEALGAFYIPKPMDNRELSRHVEAFLKI